MLSHDFYYKAHDDMTYEERCQLNYDHPDAFDTDLMIQHIKDLKDWKPIERPVYDFTIHNRVAETVTVRPAKVVVVEGILIFENKELLDLFDIKVLWTPTPTCGSSAASCGTCRNGAGPWNPW